MDRLTSSKSTLMTTTTVTMQSRKMSWDCSNLLCGNVNPRETSWENSTSKIRSRGVWPLTSWLKSSRTIKVLRTTPSSHSSYCQEILLKLNARSRTTTPEQAPQVWSQSTVDPAQPRPRRRSPTTTSLMTTKATEDDSGQLIPKSSTSFLLMIIFDLTFNFYFFIHSHLSNFSKDIFQ